MINWRVNDHPAPRTLLPCGPDSFVYLTQAQQDYRFVGRRENAPDVERAKHEDADAKVTLRVVDARGEPVAAADVQVVFFYRGLYPINGKTDVNGFSHVAESRSRALGQIPKSGFENWDLKADMHYDARHYSHSREFRSNVVDEWGFWNKVFDACGFNN